jgi:anti-anti-sigma factor
MSTATTTLPLDGELTIYRAAELKPLLLQRPDGDAALALDLSQVSEIDTAGVQLLLLARREAALQGRGFGIAAVSPAVADALELLGLADLMPTPAAEACA